MNHRRGYSLRQNLSAFAREYQTKSPAIVGLNNNDAGEYPEGGPQKMVDEVKAAGDGWNYSGTFLRGSLTIKILAPALAAPRVSPH